MRTIKLIDMTLRETGAIRDNTLSFKEKLEIARILDRLKADVIELPPLSGSKADQLSNKTIASTVKTGLSAAVDIASGNVGETWESIKNAAHPQLNLEAPVSTVQMEYVCHKKAPAMLELIRSQVEACRYYCENVEFTALDASRAERDFLYKAVETAIEAGAGMITVCDSAGILLPDELTDLIENLRANVSALSKVQLFVNVRNTMHMATACATYALRAGADGVKCTTLPAGYATTERMIHFIQTKGVAFGITTNVRTTEISRAVSQLEWILSPREKSTSAFEGMAAAAETTGICLDINDDIDEVIKVVRQLGYELSDEDNSKVYEAFRRVAAKKQFVGTKELDAIVASTALQVPSTYQIVNYVINCGNIITATANILLTKDGQQLRGIGVGDGPIDAAFLAIEQIIGHHYELDDFQIQTVSEGRDAMGSAVVKLRADGKVYSGSGISTDIIGASIRAYISALNKIVYEE